MGGSSTRDETAAEAATSAEPVAGVPTPILGSREGQLVGRYRLLQRVGAGAMGEVYRAHDPGLDRDVALKLIARHLMRATRAQARMLREAQAMARLSHPNVVAVLDVGQSEDTVYLAMELVQGEDLRAWLRKERSWSEIVDAFIQAGEGLAAAHEAGLVHRDFKPDNVLIDDNGRVRVADFGLATADRSSGVSTSGAEPSFDSLTSVGSVLGTPAYMAPEHLRGSSADPLTDQFSFCVSLYEALFGIRPFAAQSMEARVREIGRGQLISPTQDLGAPPWLRPVVERGLASDPEARHESMRDLVDALRRRGRKPWLGLLAMGGAVVAAGAFAIASSSEDEDPCRWVDEGIEGTWSSQRRASLRDGLGGIGGPAGASIAQRVDERLDGFAGQWQRHARALCEGPRADATAFDARVDCFERRLQEFDAVVGTLMGADAASAARAMEVLARLGDPEDCEEDSSGPPLPPDPERRTRVRELRAQMVRVKVTDAAGDFANALAMAQEVTGEARELGFDPLLAEALATEAVALAHAQGRDERAIEMLEEAASLAAATRHDEVAARAWDSLLMHGAILHADPQQLERYRREGEAALERLGDTHGPRSAGHASASALAYERENRYQDAVAEMNHAIELTQALYGADDYRIANLRGHLLRLHTRAGELGAADEEADRAVAMTERAFGKDHPAVATVWENVSELRYRQGRVVEALEGFSRVLEIRRAFYPADHTYVVQAMNNYAIALLGAERFDEAKELFKQTLELDRKRQSDPVNMAQTLNNLAAAEQMSEDFEGAEAHFRESLVLLEGKLGAEHPELRTVLESLGFLLAQTERPDEARRLLLRSKAIWEATGRTDHPEYAELVSGIQLLDATHGSAPRR